MFVKLKQLLNAESAISVSPVVPLKSRLIFASVLLFIAFAISVIVVFVTPLTLSIYVPAERFLIVSATVSAVAVSSFTSFVFPVVGADCCKFVGKVAPAVIFIKSAFQVSLVIT